MTNKKISIIGLLIVMVVLFGFTGCKSSDEAKNVDLTTLSLTTGLAKGATYGNGFRYTVYFSIKTSALGEGVTITGAKMSFLKGGNVGGTVDYSATDLFSSASILAAQTLTSKTKYITAENEFDTLKIEVTYTNSKNESSVESGTLNIKGLADITYRVTGVKRARSIIFTDENGNSVTKRGVVLPFTYKFKGSEGRYVSCYASNDMNSGTIKVELLVNDKVMLVDTGQYSARVSGSL